MGYTYNMKDIFTHPAIDQYLYQSCSIPRVLDCIRELMLDYYFQNYFVWELRDNLAVFVLLQFIHKY